MAVGKEASGKRNAHAIEAHKLERLLHGIWTLRYPPKPLKRGANFQRSGSGAPCLPLIANQQRLSLQG